MTQPRLAVVDEDAAFLSLLCTILKEETSYDIISCSSSQEAAETIRRDQPTLIILAIHMASAPPWTLLSMLRLDPLTKHIPALICAEDPLVLRKREFLEHRQYGVLESPFDIGELLAKIEELIQLTQAGS
jgi:CheY-like chemotaxis protein